jgi:hypothetical protein
MGILLNIAKQLHQDFHESGASTLNRESTLELLELVKELAGQVEHLTFYPSQDKGGQQG